MSKMSFRRLSFRQVLFVLSGILVHYVGYYSFYRVYSFITSGIIRFIGYTHSLCRISLRRVSLRRISLRRISLRRVSLRRVSSPLYVCLAVLKQKRKQKTWRTLYIAEHGV